MKLTLALAQANFTVGDIEGNLVRLKKLHARASHAGADLLMVSEMAVTGYPAEDLVLRHRFQDEAMRAAEAMAGWTAGGAALLTGGLWKESGKLYNTLFLMADGAILRRQYKHHLPNYGVFDEKRVFAEGPLPATCDFKGVKLGMLICEDMWARDTTRHLKTQGAELLLVINASPYEIGKARYRRELAQEHVRATGVPLVYVNQVGGQDELVFDGRSFVLDQAGETKVRLKSMLPDFEVITIAKGDAGWSIPLSRMEPIADVEETIYNAMVLGLRDYVEKNRFPGVVLGLSGGIDSAISAAVAVDALGADRVRAIMMPSPYTSQASLDDAAECARLLGIRLDTVSIEPAMGAFDTMLAAHFGGKAKDTTEENIQSRVRGMILMGLSNKEGFMVLTTGNKSEMSVGYATLYGDMCGGYSVLKDLYKTTVYKVSRWRNAKSPVMPERVITKAPTAELRPNQTDQDSLPPYELLDAILERLIERQHSVAEIALQGYDKATVERVARLLYNAEYKRRQSPPGVKVTGMSFGRDRRYPITSGWKS